MFLERVSYFIYLARSAPTRFELIRAQFRRKTDTFSVLNLISEAASPSRRDCRPGVANTKGETCLCHLQEPATPLQAPVHIPGLCI